MNHSKLEDIYKIMKMHKNKYFIIDYWRVIINLNLGTNYGNKQLAHIINFFVKVGKAKRIGKESKYLYKVVKNG